MLVHLFCHCGHEEPWFAIMHARSFEKWALHFSPSVHGEPNPIEEFYLGGGGGRSFHPKPNQIPEEAPTCTKKGEKIISR